ncbi:unnamed protein product [Fusarium graminearum]|uniref:T6SS Phospholipase effector Tle1-like catalytic domain-containing protein n=1 Tax=Gibberella zeae TaxID=5518 RepID=A0A4E9E9M9_GIBZA|nr:unnamed protein product [Fusarium graminearum]
MSSVPPAKTSRLLWVSFDGTLAGGLGSCRDTVVSVLPDLISQSENLNHVFVPGVGSGFTPFTRVFGVLCGWGTQHNVITAYRSIATAYVLGDKIILCGYSRGAWAARYLAQIISLLGLPKRCNNNFIHLLDKHCDRDPTFQRPVDPKLLEYDRWNNVEIEALCCFDTVGSLGLPLYGIAKPLSILRRGPRKADIVSTVASNVKNSFHCLALHEQREPFSPTYMRGKNVHQVFFLGNHGDMGWIDRRKESFVHAPLAWIVQQLDWHSGIRFDEVKLKEYFPSYGRDPGNDLPCIDGPIARTSRITRFFMGVKERQPWNVANYPHTANNGENNGPDTTGDTILSDVQIHVSARYYEQPDRAVLGYTPTARIGEKFHYIQRGNVQQSQGWSFLGNSRRNSSSSSSSLKKTPSTVASYKRIAYLLGSEPSSNGGQTRHRIYPALVGPLEAKLLALPTAAVSSRACCAPVRDIAR